MPGSRLVGLSTFLALGSICKMGIICPRTVKIFAYSTNYSQAVTHPSIDLARCCLTLVIIEN